MAAQKGRNYVIKFNTAASTYAAIGGMREPSITINNEPVDVTNADDAGIRKLLEGAGVTSMTIKGNGVFTDDTVVTALRTAASLNQHKLFQFVIPGTAVKTIAGSFMIASSEDTASYKENGNYSITLESAGAWTIT